MEVLRIVQQMEQTLQFLHNLIYPSLHITNKDMLAMNTAWLLVIFT